MHWKYIKLGIIANFKNGLNYSKDNWGHGLKVVGVSSFKNLMYPVYDDLSEINPHGVVKENDYLQENDIVFVRSNGNRNLIGRSLLIKNLKIKVSHSGFTIRARIFDKNSHAPFYFYLFRSNVIRSILTIYGSGTNINNLNQKILSNLPVPIPPLPTQKKIAAILSAYDDLIENNKRRIALLENMAEEIYREWFVRFRFPDYEKTTFVKGIPEGWEFKPLTIMCDDIRESIHKKDLSDDDIYLGLEHLSRRSISIKKTATAASISSNKLKFHERDILFGKIRPYLHKVAISHIAGSCSSDTIVIRPKRKLYEAYLLFTLFSNTFIDIATISSKGTKMPRADWEYLKGLKFTIPTDNILSQYQYIFDNQLDQIFKLLHINENLTKTKNMLLPRLISGKLSVEDLDIAFPPSMQDDEHEKG